MGLRWRTSLERFALATAATMNCSSGLTNCSVAAVSTYCDFVSGGTSWEVLNLPPAIEVVETELTDEEIERWNLLTKPHSPLPSSSPSPSSARPSLGWPR